MHMGDENFQRIEGNFANVNGLKIFDKGTIHEYFLKKIKKKNYIVNQFLFNCEDLGIPQKRERLIIVGTRKRKKLNINLKKEDEIYVREAIDDLPNLENGNRRWETMAEGEATHTRQGAFSDRRMGKSSPYRRKGRGILYQ